LEILEISMYQRLKMTIYELFGNTTITNGKHIHQINIQLKSLIKKDMKQSTILLKTMAFGYIAMKI